MLTYIEVAVESLAIIGAGLFLLAIGIGSMVSAIWFCVWSIRKVWNWAQESPNDTP